MTPELQALAKEAATYALDAFWDNFPEYVGEVATPDKVSDADWDEFYLEAEKALVAQFTAEMGES